MRHKILSQLSSLRFVLCAINSDVNTQHVLEAYKASMKFSDNKHKTLKEYMLNLDDKIKDNVFLGDMSALLRQSIRISKN